jgi:hypothetical protein
MDWRAEHYEIQTPAQQKFTTWRFWWRFFCVETGTYPMISTNKPLPTDSEVI